MSRDTYHQACNIKTRYPYIGQFGIGRPRTPMTNLTAFHIIMTIRPTRVDRKESNEDTHHCLCGDHRNGFHVSTLNALQLWLNCYRELTQTHKAKPEGLWTYANHMHFAWRFSVIVETNHLLHLLMQDQSWTLSNSTYPHW